MSKNYLLLFLSFFISLSCLAQGSEDFSNADISSSYSEGSFTGNDGIIWSYVHARNEATFPIDGNGIMLRRANEPSSVSATIPGGIENFSVDTRKAFTNDSQRNLELVINDQVIAQFQPSYGSGEDATVIPFIVEDINIEGEFTLELRMFGSNGNQQIILDNISWTEFASVPGECPLPEGETEQTFDEGATIADIEVTGENLTWYEDATGLIELDETTLLEDDTIYYVSQTTEDCESELLAITISLTMSVADQEFKDLSFYPNPTENILHISNQQLIKTVEIYNLIGQRVYQQHINANNTQIDISKFAKGTYAAKITTNRASKTLKIIKQ